MADNNEFIKRLTGSTSLTDVLIQMEDFLDGLDLYVFKNWFEGTVVEGPIVARHWVSMILEYPYDKMPDPSGGLRLLKHGARVAYKKAKQQVPQPIKSPSDYRPEQMGKPKLKNEEVWLVEIQIPRRFIEELNDDEIESQADEHEVDSEQVSDARDEDIQDDDAINKDDATEDADPGTDLGDEEEDQS